uniref:Uncharacterized protein n=1 Tax=Prevotella sp. GTC17259 TaxID=3236795 RepID=A0AB33J211_9BACT
MEHQLWIQTACLALAALMMVQLNNAYALIRIYSRMVSCSFLVLCTMAAFLLPSQEGSILQLCIIAFLLFLFRGYQDNRATGWVFYAFAMWGIASIFFVHILYFVPILWVILYTNILAGSVKTLCASLLGLSVPYWFLAGYDVWTGHPVALMLHFQQLAHFQPVGQIQLLTTNQLLTCGFLLILAVTGTIHFFRHSYNDKIRTRMFYEVFVVIDAAAFVFIFLQPQHYSELLRICIVTTAPLIGHFLALTRTRITNIAFHAMLAAALVITVINLWFPSLSF